MTLYELNRFGHDIYTDARVRDLYKRDRDKALSEFKLSNKELEAIKKGDIKTLDRMGVHQFLIWHIAQIEHIPPKEYMRRINEK